MKLKIKTPCWLLCCFLLLISQGAFCKVRLPVLISDGMVIQRDIDVKIWGWADEGEKVKIKFTGKTYNTSAGKDKRWEVLLTKSKAGGPHNMIIEGDNHITLKDIMFGDVWICSGQSNMELSMDRVKYRYPDVIANSNNPSIRQFVVPDIYNFKKPQEDLSSGKWISANPDSIYGFSAVGYFFAKELFEKYHVPIGLINSALGGSPAQAWLSEEALKAFPEHLETAIKLRDDALIKKIIENDKAVSDEWYNRVDRIDKGLQKGRKPWFDPDLDASKWATMNIPGYWADHELGPVNGVVWFRKEITVPASMTGKPAKLWLGRVVDADTTYVNGKVVGSVTYKYPPRIYDIPGDLLKAGKNVITIRVINNSGQGGFYPDKPYKLSTGDRTIDLKGPWKYKLGAVMEPLPGQTFIRWKPMGLYNAMIAPLLNYKIKGVIWYQGESNAGKPLEYDELFAALITDWRSKWNQGEFPFLYVQLANFMETRDDPGESNWAELREAQLSTLSIPNTAMAVTIDIGEWNDIHPLNKEDVGKRLALGARRLAYGDRNVVYSGPVYKSMKIKGNKITLSFSHTGSGLMAKGGNELTQFAIAGPDKKFIWAKAKIEGDTVIAWNDNINNPVAVRYGWADNPEGLNLYNMEGLPASPFRTDK
ncbi:sialate O-acetylesterase [Thermodesulfobacteriota bacterium]